MKEENKIPIKKKIISTEAATRGLINGFISYGILIGFIFLIIFLIIINCIDNILGSDVPYMLNYTLPAIAATILFFIIRSVCYLSTYDLFKKCKVEKDNINIISSNMNLFYILFVILTLAIVTVNLIVMFRNQKTEIEQTRDTYYEIYTEDFANDLTADMIEDFSKNKFTSIMQSLIIEFGIFLGTFSLLTTQKKLIEKLN